MIVRICPLIIAAHAGCLSISGLLLQSVCMLACSTETLHLMFVVWKHNMGLMHCACICETQTIQHLGMQSRHP